MLERTTYDLLDVIKRNKHVSSDVPIGELFWSIYNNHLSKEAIKINNGQDIDFFFLAYKGIPLVKFSFSDLVSYQRLRQIGSVQSDLIGNTLWNHLEHMFN